MCRKLGDLFVVGDCESIGVELMETFEEINTAFLCDAGRAELCRIHGTLLQHDGDARSIFRQPNGSERSDHASEYGRLGLRTGVDLLLDCSSCRLLLEPRLRLTTSFVSFVSAIDDLAIGRLFAKSFRLFGEQHGRSGGSSAGELSR